MVFIRVLKNFVKPIFICVLIISILFNVFLLYRYYDLFVTYKDIDAGSYVVFDDANSRNTLFSFHNIKKAYEFGQGEGIKVGILDSNFNYGKYADLYAGKADFANNSKSLNELEGHGFWMATILREVAPKCEIYALNTPFDVEDEKETMIIEAINWAIENKIDILSYSSTVISEKNRKIFDNAIQKANENGIVTTFIHYPAESNLLPDGFFTSKEVIEYVGREGDINVFHYDYNSFDVEAYKKYREAVRTGTKIESIPFLSVSSTAPATAGFVAILKSINPNLTPDEYKDALIKTSYVYQYSGQNDFEKNMTCPHVVDLYEAAKYVTKK